MWVSKVKIYQILIYAFGASILVRKYAKYCPAQTICHNFNCKFSTHELSEKIIIIFPVLPLDLCALVDLDISALLPVNWYFLNNDDDC